MTALFLLMKAGSFTPTQPIGWIAIEEESDIRHEFAHPPRVRSLVDGPLQHVSLSNAFQKRFEFGTVGIQTGFVQVPSKPVTGRMIIFVPQYETVTQINFKCSGLLLEHSNHRVP